MKLPVLKTLRVEDFPDQKGWIEKLVYSINSFLDTVVLAFNRGLTFSDNFNASVKTLEIIGGIVPVDILHGLRNAPIGVQIFQVYEKADIIVTIGTAVTLEWYNVDATQVRIKNITGLTSGTKYIIKILIIGG